MTEERNLAEQLEIAALTAQKYAHSTLNALPDHICILDRNAKILFVNRAWRQFGLDNPSVPQQAFEGANYLQKCCPLFSDDTTQNDLIAAGLGDVLAGKSMLFETVYACNFPTAQQWFKLRISAISDQGRAVAVVMHSDITESKLTKLALENSYAKVKDLEHAMDEHALVSITDRRGTINYVNEKFCDVSGYRREELIGKNHSLLNSDFHPPEFMQQLWHTIRQGSIWQGEMRDRGKDGHLFWVDATIVPFLDQAGQPYQYVAIRNDINSRKQSEEALQELNQTLEQRVVMRTIELAQAKEHAEKASRAKAAFLANMSHEIRTPMNAVIGMSYLALKTGMTAKQRTYLENIHHSGEHLLGIINDVLDISKIEADKLIIENIDFTLAEVLNKVTDIISPKAREKGLQLEVDIDPSLPATLRGDPMRLIQVLLNFTSNAVKFTDCGKVAIHISKLEENAKSCLIKLEVKDSGIGLSADQQALLFQPFQQADASITRKFGGTGLGLLICKQLATLMGGEVGMESNLELGSTFWFTARLNPCQTGVTPTLQIKEEKLDPMQCLVGKHILVVEDNEFNQQVACELLEGVGIIITVANNGKEAVALSENKLFDAILMDLQMPVMDGFDATKKIRAAGHQIDVPIIALTANAYSEDRKRCMDAGMHDFIAKPVHPALLYSTLAKWLGKSTLEQVPLAQEQNVNVVQVTSSVPNDPDIINLAILAQMVGDEPETIRMFANKFLDAATTGINEINVAIRDQNLERATGLGHRLKSSARTVGALGFGEICQSLEELKHGGTLAQAIPIVAKLTPLLERIAAHVAQTTGAQTEQASATHPSHRAYEPKMREELRCMVVDDEPFQVDLIGHHLRALGITDIETETNARQALSRLKQRAPDVLLCDLSMAGMDGIEFLRLVAEHGYSGSVVLITGLETALLHAAESLVKAHGLKLLGGLKKPIDLAALEMTLSRVNESRIRPIIQKNIVELGLDELREGLADDCIELYFQPKVSLHERRMVGAECLARWRHPTQGLLAPSAFVPAMESHGMIDQLTDIVLRKAASYLALWQRDGHDFKLAINVSMNNLNRIDLPENYENIVRAAGTDTRYVVLEITESRLMNNLKLSLEILTRLRLKGFVLSIDNFGTGFSSIEGLKQLPFSELKIDRTFVHGAMHDSAARAILESSTQLGKIFRLNLVAEGVETQQDWDIVSEYACNEAQGYFIARPMPGLELIDWKEKWEASAFTTD